MQDPVTTATAPDTAAGAPITAKDVPLRLKAQYVGTGFAIGALAQPLVRRIVESLNALAIRATPGKRDAACAHDHDHVH